MLLEMHCHSSLHSACSMVDPVTLVKKVLEKQLQGMVITEHHYLWTQDEIKRLRKDTEVNENFIILAGQEVVTEFGHILVFGVNRTIEKPLALEELRDMFPDAALVWAHPFRGGSIPDKDKLLDPLLDAVEIFNTNQTMKENYTGLKMWHEFKFAAIGGSDTHSEEKAGRLPTQFDHPFQTIEEMIKEIKGARCRPFIDKQSLFGR